MSREINESDRKPSAAGRFYSDNGPELTQTIEELFLMAKPETGREALAIIVPHAGYVFSGKIAASGIKQIASNRVFERIFLIGSSHYEYFEGASVFSQGDFIIPGKKIELDKEYIRQLLADHPHLFNSNPSPHLPEHCLEVELPLLDHYLNHSFKIVPIILGTHDPKICELIAKALAPELNERNLFVISTDFSHYPSEDDAIKIDQLTEEAILSGNPDKLRKELNELSLLKIRGQQTSLCGWTSVLTLLYMLQGRSELELIPIDHGTSADASYYGDKHRVVGYRSIALVRKETDLLNTKEQKELLEHARESIKSLFGKSAQKLSEPSGSLNAPCGAFVTIHNKGRLRGCYGRMYSEDPLWDTVNEMAIWSASRDSRFLPVTEDELPEIDLEISVLSPMKKIDSIDEIQLGVHGIYIKQDFRSGVFLPQVATETGWNLEEFLGHCARDKAHIGWDGWKSAEIFIFSCQVFSEMDL